MDNEQYAPNGSNTPFSNGEAPQPMANNQMPNNNGYPTPNPYGDPTGGGFTSPATGDIVLQPDAKQKKRKGLIAAIIIILVLAIGGGAFAAVAIMDSQPNNIAASALNNLMNANQVTVAGPVNIAFKDTSLLGISSININLNEQTVNSNNSTSADIGVTFANGDTIDLVKIGEVMMNDGVFYLKVDGLKTLYSDTFYNQISAYISEGLRSNYYSSTVTDCYSTAVDNSSYQQGTVIQDCVSTYTTGTDPEVDAAINATTTAIMTELGGIIDAIDGQWIEFSIDDILSSDMLGVPAATRQSITAAYDCAIDKFNNFSQYSNELSQVYSQNSFLTLTAAQNSFYDVSLDANKLAGYLNSVSKTQLFNDLAGCTGNSGASLSAYEVTAEDIAPSLAYLPQISAKFGGGLFNHYLSELKMTESNDYYEISSDLNFTYTGTTISAPSDARPVMEIVQSVYNRIYSLQTALYAI